MPDPVIDIVTPLQGPLGALVAVTIAAVALWQQHRRDDAAKDKLTAELLASKDKDIDFERTRTEAAEARLDGLGETLKATADVMERSVVTTEKAIDELARARTGG